MTAPKRTDPPLLFPFLFAAVPILALWLANTSQGAGMRDALFPILISVGATLLVTVVAGFLLRRDFLKGGLVAALVLLFVFAYGPIRSGLGDLADAPAVPWVALGLLASACAVGVVAVARTPPTAAAALTRGLNVVAVGLVLFNVVGIGLYELRSGRPDARIAPEILAAARRGTERAGRPDIYYIMLDDYGGEKAMRDLLGFDNSPFLDALRRRGFYVVPRATTNYARTDLSLASSLNMQYVERFVPRDRPLSEGTLTPYVMNDAVPAFLKAKGYRYIHIGSWWRFTATNPQADQNVTLGRGISEFSQALLGQTAIEPALEAFGTTAWDRQQYRRALFQFDQASKAKALPGPTFVFDHILVPHWPYIFDASGRFDDSNVRVSDIKRPLAAVEERTRRRYIQQLQFANRRTLRLIDTLLSGPPQARPVIVLQSDEGFFTWLLDGPNASDRALEQHFNILNAYYFPRLERTGLYPTITPVNSFRLLFDDYFGADLPLLPDRNEVIVRNRGGYVLGDVTPRVRALI